MYRAYFKGYVARDPTGKIMNFPTRKEAETFIGIENTQMEYAEFSPEELERNWKIKEIKNEQTKRTIYYVIDTTPEVQSDGFYQKSLGTHTTKDEIYSTQKVLYEGPSPHEANRIYRHANKGSHRYDDDHNTMIYKGYEGEERVVLHKV